MMKFSRKLGARTHVKRLKCIYDLFNLLLMKKWMHIPK